MPLKQLKTLSYDKSQLFGLELKIFIGTILNFAIIVYVLLIKDLNASGEINVEMIDIFCEKGCFEIEDSERILTVKKKKYLFTRVIFLFS